MLRWRIAILVSAAIAISYFDRQTLPVAIHAIGKDIPLTNEQFSELNSAFLFTYALMYMGGGKLADALGTRLGFTLVMIFWSLACASHALAVGFFSLLASRLLLGIGEGGGFPAATRVVAEWFPVRERSTSMGIINAGTAVGGYAAAPLIALILLHLHWRWVFVITGTFGIIWTFAWLKIYFPPQSHPKLSAGERAEIESVFEQAPGGASSSAQGAPKIRWLDLLRIRESWGLVLAKFLTDGAWYFYLFWLPKYLFDARGFNIKAVGKLAGIPFLAAGIGCLLGGWFSSHLIRRSFSLGVARKLALGLSAAVMPMVFFIPHARISLVFVIFSLAYFGQQSWSTMVMVLPTDLFPQRVVGAVAGLVGFGGAMGGIVFGQVVGYLLDHGFGWGVVFSLAGTFHVIAFCVILLMIPAVKPLDLASQLGYEGAR
ncbi:MAG TPA: MFS transporter [Candidatus Acidoferrales bacterium]|nr:MFS transporter [Candidatus Acidoferrales bacterium]